MKRSLTPSVIKENKKSKAVFDNKLRPDYFLHLHKNDEICDNHEKQLDKDTKALNFNIQKQYFQEIKDNNKASKETINKIFPIVDKLENITDEAIKRIDQDIKNNKSYDFSCNTLNIQNINHYILPEDMKHDEGAMLINEKESVTSHGSVNSKNENIKFFRKSLIALHPLEYFLLKQAMSDFNNEHYTNKVVLVDIFARKQGGIKLTDNNEYETHTIVLYHQNSEILIIDPNNSDNSSHLSNKLVSNIADENYKFVAPLKTIKIYCAPTNPKIGFDANEWRECSDISTKLAIELNKNEKHIDINALHEVEAVLTITNNPEINKSLPSLVSELSFHDRQSSVADKKKIVDTLIKSIKKVDENKDAIGVDKYITFCENIKKTILTDDSLLKASQYTTKILGQVDDFQNNINVETDLG